MCFEMYVSTFVQEREINQSHAWTISLCWSFAVLFNAAATGEGMKSC